MPYESNSDLPESVRGNLPEHAQIIYRKAYNSAWTEYEDAATRRDDETREETAHRVAWSAVKKGYEKDAGSGVWSRR